jgi:hypothetical protein
VSLPPAGDAAVRPWTAGGDPLPVYRLNLMRIGYLVMAVGLAVVVIWPEFIQVRVASLPVFEGVVAALLAAMSLLAFLGLRYPVQLLPLLIFESLWKLLWLGAVATPHLIAGDMTEEMGTVLGSVALVVVIIAVTPWDYVWKRYVVAPGARWR